MVILTEVYYSASYKIKVSQLYYCRNEIVCLKE